MWMGDTTSWDEILIGMLQPRNGNWTDESVHFAVLCRGYSQLLFLGSTSAH